MMGSAKQPNWTRCYHAGCRRDARNRVRMRRLVALLLATWAVWLSLCFWGLWVVSA